jgi:Zn-dependent M28 family amino/carboxypeptidase
VLAADATPHFDGTSWWRTVRVLADDALEGRETGSPGERSAQDYIVAQLKAMHVKPAGSDGYFQPVELRTRTLVETDSSLALVKDGVAHDLTLGEEAFFSTRYNLAPEVSAPLVFVGYGLNIPEVGYNDYADLDLKGKIAVILSGSPSTVTSALAAHYQTRAERWKTLQAAGAIGVVSIPNPASMDIPWSRMMINRLQPSMDLAAAEFDEAAGVQLAATVNPAHADLLFEGTGHTFAELAALGKERAPLPRFELPVSIRARTHTASTPVHSRNLVAVIPGSDPRLKQEYVVLSAHLDHLGVGAPVNGDSIYNGAMDNGSGSALLLDMARALGRPGVKLRRSVLLVWVTAEEKGLLGSRYFAGHPTVPKGSIVADINTDMFLPIIPLKIITVLGLAESDLGELATAVANEHHIAVQPDPEPLRNSFVRSDQYNFIRAGIPSLALTVGALADSPERAVLKTWLTERYHAPSDDLQQPVNLATAAGFEEVIRGLVIRIANAPSRPSWKPDSFFRRFAQGPQH